MDPNNSDLPQITSDHLAADPNPPPPPFNHALPPYEEMIIAAIAALKDKDGSSRQAISKYMEKEYANNLPSTHSTLLTHHLKRMKNEGQLMMVKHSYMLPARSVAPFQPPTGYHPSLDFGGGSSNVTDGSATTGTGTVTGGNGENSVGLLKRKPGRPPKLRPDAGFVVQEPLPNVPNVRPFDGEVPPYQPQFQYNVGVGQDFQTQAHLGGTGQDLHLNYGSGSGSEFQGNSGRGAEPLFASLGLGDDGVVVPSPPPAENTSVVAKRGRGRPPKAAGGSGGFDGAGSGGDGAGSGSGGDVAGEIQGNQTGSGRPVRKPKMMSVLMGTNGGRVKKGRGRPRKIGIGPVTVPLSGNVLRPRGRPKRAVGRPVRSASNVAVNGGVSDSGLASRRSGRPSISSGANNIAKLTAKPVGRPSKIGSGTAVLVTDPRQLVVYQELKNRYELLQSKVKQVTSVVKPCIDPNYGNAALGALQELEALAGADANASSNIQIQEPVSFH